MSFIPVEAFRVECDKCHEKFRDGEEAAFGLREWFDCWNDELDEMEKWQVVKVKEIEYIYCGECRANICGENWSEMDEDEIEQAVENYATVNRRT